MELTPIAQCPNTLTHRAHMINGANGREACPGIETDKITMTQEIADLWSKVASHPNHDISWGRGPFYAGLERTLIAAIVATYPDVHAETVYELMIDSGESVAQCVDHWRERNEQHEWCKHTYDGDADDANLICAEHKTILTPGRE